MSEDKILEDLKAYKGPTELPKIATYAAAIYEAKGFKLDDEGADLIRQALAQHAGNLKDLTDNILGLGAFAIWIRDSRNDLETAEKIARIIGEHSPQYIPIGQRIANALQDLAIKAGDIFADFTGKDSTEKKRAPKHDAAAPEGSLQAKKIIPVAEPPLHLRKKKR